MADTFATLADVLDRYPNEATILAADEETRERDDSRIEKALVDASTEVRTALFARYTRQDLARIDDDSRAALRVYAIDIALYRVSLSHTRSSDTLKERYDIAIARLTAIAVGKAALTFDGPGGGGVPGGSTPDEPTSVGPAEPIVQVPERLFTRDRLGGW